MGINIHNNVVSYAPNHERNLNTSVTKNPRTRIIEELKIISVFKRTKDENRKDGNPLIYALKGGTKYWISKDDICHLSKNAKIIMSKIPNHFTNPDYIVPVPSGSLINDMLARRIQRYYPNNPSIVSNALRKATLQEILNDLPPVRDVPIKVRGDFTSSLNTLQKGDPNNSVQMKLVKKTVSKYFYPIRQTGNFMFPADSRILFVDDLYSSGSTILSAVKSIGIEFERGQVGSVVLLSPI